MANRRSIVSLQQLMIEALTMIVEKIGKSSSADYYNARATYKKLKEASNSPIVLHSLCLSLLVKRPLCALEHMEQLEKCVEQENYAGYFVRGILSYFIEDDPVSGMEFLQLAAIGEGADLILEASYLYSVLRILHGNPGEGEEHMAMMNWQDDDDFKTANEVWKKLRNNSLHGINVSKKQVYVQSMHNMMALNLVTFAIWKSPVLNAFITNGLSSSTT